MHSSFFIHTTIIIFEGVFIMDNSIKSKLMQRVSKDPQGVLSIMKKAGVQMSKEEMSAIQSGNVSRFSDKQLDQCFSAKVLGMMGIMMGSGKMKDEKK